MYAWEIIIKHSWFPESVNEGGYTPCHFFEVLCQQALCKKLLVNYIFVGSGYL